MPLPTIACEEAGQPGETGKSEAQEMRVPADYPPEIAAKRDHAADHQTGASLFGADWMTANLSACNVLMASGLRPEEHKTLGTLIATRLCRWIAEGRKQGALECK